MDTPGTQPTLTSALRLGGRFSVRYRVPGDTHPFTDVVGTVEALDKETAAIRTRRGETQVPLEAIVAVREVPPAPQRRGRREFT